MSLEFNSEAAQVSSLFTAYRNDIDIYTEDTDKCKNFYLVLLKRLLEGTGIKINDVYPIGSSNEVYQACQSDHDTTRHKIYIVDGDIYLMYNPKQTIKNLFVLDAYCIENLVIDEDAVCHALCHLHGEKEFNDYKTCYDFEKLVQEHLCLIELFYYKALDKKYANKFRLYSLGTYYDNKNNINLSSIQNEIDEIRNRLNSEGLVTEDKILKDIEEMQKKFPKSRDTLLKIVSGKDFLLHMIGCHAKRVINMPFIPTKQSWKYNLALYCNLGRFQTLKDAIVNQTL